MYCYFYDSCLNADRYQRNLIEVENRLADLGIKDRLIKLTPLTSRAAALDRAVKDGAKTVVAVGSDAFFADFLDLVVNKNITLGFIPIGSRGLFERILGLNTALEACDVLAARRLIKIDVGVINNQAYFLSHLSFAGTDSLLRLDNYVLSAKNSRFFVVNFKPLDFPGDWLVGVSAEDGLLNVLAINEEKKVLSLKKGGGLVLTARFPIKNLIIDHVGAPINVVADGKRIFKTPLEIGVLKKSLSLIVGKNRTF